MRDGERTARQYDAMGRAYGEHNADGAFNAYYERPAMMALLGEVAGRRVLEVGCGPGLLTRWLADQGAVVTAMDVSTEMVRLASARVGDRARVLVADLAEPLTFAADGPAMDWQLHSPEDYFAVKQVTETWDHSGGSFDVTFWRRPLSAMTVAIAASGFVIDLLAEPQPAPELRELDPQVDTRLRTKPAFLFFRLAKPGPSLAAR